MIHPVLLVDDMLLQDCESDNNEDRLDFFLNHIGNLLKKHDLLIICNSAYPKAVRTLRHTLKEVIPADRIMLFHLPFSGKRTSYQTEANSYVFDYFLSQLAPCILLSVAKDENEGSADNCRIILRKIKRKAVPAEKKHKPKLAYFSPLPPVKSGIAGYSSELLPSLNEYYDIKVIVESKEMPLWDGDGKFDIYSVEEFMEHNKEFDRILYHFGNSFYHSYMWPMLKEYPGVVMLHDFFLSGLLSYEEIVNDKKMFWTEQLFNSHGYKALQERLGGDIEKLSYQYPCNYEIIQFATGIITHSEYSKRLAKEWYTQGVLDSWRVIPLLRIPVDQVDRKQAREKLGYAQDDLLICSFGLLNDTKLNHKLLQAFLSSRLAHDPKCHLIYVGEFTSEAYAVQMREVISSASAGERIEITGWRDDETFKLYLEAANIGVQLRTASRGETSAAVLDCMNYSLATIVNANGSIADLPDDTLYKLEDDFDEHALRMALEELGTNGILREKLGVKAKEYIRAHHEPEQCAAKYRDAIEIFTEAHQNYTDTVWDISAGLHSVKDPQLVNIAQAISGSTLPAVTQKQMLVDISAIVQNDLRTGIQRVVRAQLMALIRLAPKNLRIEPVYLSSEGGFHYRYARYFTCKMLNIPIVIPEDPVEVQNGDIFYGLDFHWDGVIKASQSKVYEKWASEGVQIAFMLYDLLPIQYPELFPNDAAKLHTQWLYEITAASDTLICISQAVANAYREWSASSTVPAHWIPHTKVVHLGADIDASLPTGALPDDTADILENMEKQPTFIMVGTIEPRKGHLLTLSAFEKLWQGGSDISLVIVGSEGWKGLPASERKTIPEIVQKLRNHPESGKHLFWLEDVSDLLLQKLYHQASALIAASEDEGFGLPLIESSHYALPIIARNIPVFREVAGESAFYFPNSSNPDSFAQAIVQWLALYAEGTHPSSEHMHYITWEESAAKVLTILTSHNEERTEPQAQEKRKQTEYGSIQQSRLSYRAKEIYQALSRQIQSGEKRP